MKKLYKILKDKRGASLIIVMAIMVLLLITGASVIIAATTTMSTATAQTDAENVHRYLAELARTFEKDISNTKFFNPDGTELTDEDKTKPWYSIARYVYDKKYESIGNDISIEVKNFQIETTESIWISENTQENKSNITAKITEQNLSTRVAYLPEEREQVFDDKGEPVLDVGGGATYVVVRDEVLEQRDMRIKLDVRFEATYEGRKYNLTAKYILEGTIKRCLGDALSGDCTVSEDIKCNTSVRNGEFSVGQWKLIGYTKG